MKSYHYSFSLKVWFENIRILDNEVVSCVSHAFESVHCCLVVTCWERAGLLALVGDVYCILLLSHVVPWARSGT